MCKLIAHSVIFAVSFYRFKKGFFSLRVTDSGATCGIAYNYSNYGGGVYVKGGVANLAYGTVKCNGANYAGGGVHMSSWLNVGGNASIPAGSTDKQNGVYLNSTSVNIGMVTSAPISGSGIIAKLAPSTYNTSTKVLNDNIKAYAARFSVFPKDGNNWTIDSGTCKLIRN